MNIDTELLRNMLGDLTLQNVVLQSQVKAMAAEKSAIAKELEELRQSAATKDQ